MSFEPIENMLSKALNDDYPVRTEDDIKDGDLGFAIAIVDGMHSDMVGAINRMFMYKLDKATKAKCLAMVIEAARMSVK